MKQITTAEAEVGGISPISDIDTSAVPNILGRSINWKHCKPGGGWATSTTWESFTTASHKQLPPAIERFT